MELVMNLALGASRSFAHSLAPWLSKVTGSFAGWRAANVPAVAMTLHKGQIWSIRHPRGREVRCLRGALWVTHDGDPKDTVVAAGLTYRADRDTRMLLYALETAELRLATKNRRIA
jgi:hypothetical protein